MENAVQIDVEPIVEIPFRLNFSSLFNFEPRVTHNNNSTLICRSSNKMMPRLSCWLPMAMLLSSMMTSALQHSGMATVSGVSRAYCKPPTNGTNSSMNDTFMSSSTFPAMEHQGIDSLPNVSDMHIWPTDWINL